MNTNNYTTNMKRWLTTIVMAIFVAFPSMATSTYYYKATAHVSSTGGGKVYVSDEPGAPSSYSNEKSVTGSQDGIYAWLFGVTSTSVTFYYSAMADDGYIFDHWSKSSNGSDPVSTNANYTVSETVSSRNSGSPTPFNYYAVFKEQTGLIKVATADVTRGSVTIDPVENANGDEVVLTAYPDVANGVKFLGWSKGAASTTTFVSTANPYTLTASTETAGTYYANFSAPLEKMFCRIKNKNTGKYLSVYGDVKAGIHYNYDDGEKADGFIFENSLKLISASEAQGNPTTVFLRSGHGGMIGTTVEIDLSNMGVSYSNLITPGAVLEDADRCKLTMKPNGDGTYHIYSNVKLQRNNNQTIELESYLCDDGSNWPHSEITSNHAIPTDPKYSWEVIILDENTTKGAFGANTKQKYTQVVGGVNKYYTTMYTTFPYQLLDGVKAYYLPISESSYDQENNIVKFTEITDKVPANTAVILECNEAQNTSDSEVKNRLMPLTDYDAYISPDVNLLKGYYWLYGQDKVSNDASRMYVLSATEKEGVKKLGFFHYSQANMNPNKAYLELPKADEGTNGDLSELESTIKFRFGTEEDDTPTSIITLSEQQIGDEDAPIYDLMGRRVKNAVKGVYIQNGKKFIKK